MGATQQFVELRQRMTELEANLIPPLREDLGYTEADYDRVRAFIVLTHAEVESFLELRVLAELAKRLEAWNTSKRPSGVLMGLLAFGGTDWPATIDDYAKPRNETAPSWKLRDLQRRLDSAHATLHGSVRMTNHGIRKRNTLALLLPLGMQIDELDAALLDQLDAFGGTRGEIAHGSARRVTVQPDPGDAKARAAQLLAGLETLDAAITQLP